MITAPHDALRFYALPSSSLNGNHDSLTFVAVSDGVLQTRPGSFQAGDLALHLEGLKTYSAFN